MLIAVSSWSFHAALYKGRLRLADVPFQVFDLGYRAVELQDMFLWPKPPNPIARLLGRQAPAFDPQQYDRKALLRVRLNRLRSGTRLACWAIDSDLTAAGEAAEGQRVYLANAIEAVRFLGAPLIRLTLGGEADDQAALDRAVALMSSILPAAIAARVKLAVENHRGLSGSPDALVEFVRRCRGDQAQALTASHLGVCLDFGNFENDSQSGVRQLAPYAIHVHAKSREFDAQGEETSIDYRTSLEILKSTGYDAALSIEYEGGGDPAIGIHQTRDLIEKYW
jgi:sugar phosphate isomerase/epimerase